MRTPEFWRAGHTLLPTLLSPAAAIYDMAGRARRALVRPVRSGVPVVCIGNLVAGGGGKTPAALAVGARLQARGQIVHFLTRGHGGSLPGPVRVDLQRHTAREVGDEALLLAARAPTWVSRNRPRGAEAAVAGGAGAIVMDDGFQNPSLHKDLSLVAVDAGFGIGNGHVIPAGPLREVPGRALQRAAAVIYVADPAGARIAPPQTLANVPVLAAHLEPAPSAHGLTGAAVVAFAGIARPGKFFASLRALGCDLRAAHVFADHHRYREHEIMALVEEAAHDGAKLVTTEKDHVRLPTEARAMTETLPVTLEFEDEGALDRLLDRLPA